MQSKNHLVSEENCRFAIRSRLEEIINFCLKAYFME